MITWLVGATVTEQLTGFSLLGALLCLTGLDLWISAKRWKQGVADLNPVVQHFVKTTGVAAGVLALGAINLLVMAAAFLYLPLVWMLVGGKLALASLQIRSLINEYSNSEQPKLR